MKKKILTILSICALAVAGLAFGMLQPVEVTAATATTYYVSSSGSDEGSGKSDSPYATLDKALTMAANGDIISLKDTVKLDSWTAHGKSVTITGGSLDASGDSAVEINDSVTFTNMSWIVDSDAFVYANGYKTTIGENVSWSNEIRIFGGGQDGTTVASTDLTVLSGVYTHIYGGSNQGGTVTGNTNLTVGGTTNNSSAVDTAIENHTGKYYIFGGGHTTNTIKGSTNLVVKDQAKAVYVFGASHGYSDTRYISGSANTTILDGTMMAVFGGSQGGYASNGANVRIEGGDMQQVFGGSENWPFSMGDINLQIVGGTITRRVYGGCYNDSTNYYVQRGKINLEIGGDVNITFGASQSDKGIYARSRYNDDVEDCQIVFTSEAAYNAYKDKLGGQDWGANSIMGNTSAADTYHYYTYTANDNVLTQTCAYHNTLAATATLGLDENVSLQYTGNQITPATLAFSEDWEYDKPSIVYENNVEVGKATSSITAGKATATQSFIIVDTPVVLGGSVRLSAPSGLRFQSKVNENLKDTGATFGTLIIPKGVLGENELTAETALVENVEQTKWATDSVKKNNPEDYQDGYEYFNGVLTKIPETHYGTIIVARSYVYANGQYYYSDAIERSIAQVSAYALRDGYTNDILYDYVDKALEGATVSMTSKLTLIETETYQLALSGNKGYVAIWSSSNKDVATVDENGKITALKNEGTATITAKLGNLEVECEVTVNQKWTGYY